MSVSGDSFTKEEKEMLAPFVTNTEGSVFVLTNLPEVIKGALFSRYSRSTLGLRELLLKDFILESESEFQAIGGGISREDRMSASQESHLAVERAQKFYDRILDGYGDDSIGELGGAHLAVENLSIMATKVLEDARIGGSPLEKSTRYVSFAEKQGGDYLFYKEPTLMDSGHREAYLACNRALFQTYGELIEPITAYINQVVPRPERISPAAHARSVKAKAFDALRGLLPASTLTNMGVFGNGRFFESLLIRLQLEELTELKDLSGVMATELGKVIPSFIRRARTDNRHFEGFRHFDQSQKSFLRNLSAPIPTAGKDQGGASVTLVDHDPEAEVKILASLAFPETEMPLADLRAWAAGLSEEDKAGIFKGLGELRKNRRHKMPRATEMVFYTFDLVGDFGMYRDLHRHRMLTQTRQPLTTRLGYALPEEIREAGLADRYETVLAKAAETYEAIRKDFPAQAQYAVPMAYNIRWLVRINLRALMWLVELRSSPQGHPAYRWMAQEMFKAVRKIHPNLADLMRFIDLEEYPLGRLEAEQRQEEKQRKEE